METFGKYSSLQNIRSPSQEYNEERLVSQTSLIISAHDNPAEVVVDLNQWFQMM